eukprot:PhF_6_TR3425/c0_g1_i1/m.4967
MELEAIRKNQQQQQSSPGRSLSYNGADVPIPQNLLLPETGASMDARAVWAQRTSREGIVPGTGPLSIMQQTFPQQPFESASPSRGGGLLTASSGAESAYMERRTNQVGKADVVTQLESICATLRKLREHVTPRGNAPRVDRTAVWRMRTLIHQGTMLTYQLPKSEEFLVHAIQEFSECQGVLKVIDPLLTAPPHA